MTALCPIETLDAPRIVAAQSIYEQSFAEHLRAPFADLVGHRTDERSLALVEDGTVRGVAFVRHLGATGAAFLRYFAVEGASRGSGVGTRLWHGLCDELSSTGATLLYLDVEDPEESDVDDQERALRRRRIAFYARLGAIVLPILDYTPPHGSNPHPMLLLAADLRPTAPGPLRPGGLRDAVQLVYEHRYGIPSTDPLVRATLTSTGLT